MSSRRVRASVVQLAVILSSVLPAAPIAAAPVQDDAARVWTDTFTDATGVTLAQTVHDVPGERIVLRREDLPVTGVVGAPVPLTGNVVRSTISGSLLYVAAQTAGMHILDLADPAQPVLLATLPTTFASDIAVQGTIAYVADGTAGVRVVDVADPSAPVLLTTLATPGSDAGVEIANGLLYVASGDEGVRIYDLADPADPVFLGSASDGNGAALDLAVVGTTVLLAQEQLGGFGAGLVLVDAADPAVPVVLGAISTAEDVVEIVVRGNTAYLARTGAGLWIVDVTDPTNPVTRAVTSTPAQAVGVGLVDGDGLAVSLGAEGVLFVDVADPAAPALQLIVDTPDFAHSTVSDGAYTYVSDGSAIVVIGAPDATPAIIDAHALPAEARGIEFVIADSRLYLAAGNAGVRVYDVQVDGSLALVGSFATAGSAVGVALAGDTLLVALADTGVMALDVSDPAAITLLDTLPLADARELVVVGDRAYVAAGTAGLVVVDTSDPSALTQSGSVALPSAATAITNQSGALYVGTASSGVVAFTLVAPDAPAATGGVVVTGEVRELQVAGDVLVIAATDAVLLADVSAPLTPTLISSTATASIAASLAGGMLAVGGASQVEIFDAADLTQPLLAGALAAGAPVNDVLFAGSTLYVATDTQLLVFGSAYVQTGTAMSVPIVPASVTTWNEAVMDQTIPADTSITYDVLDGQTNTVLLAGVTPVAGRIDLSGINAAQYPTLRLRATLETTDPTLTPALNAWTVTWDAPCLIATLPVDGATAVERNYPIQLTFSESVDLASLTYETNFVGGFTRSINGDGTVVTLTPVGDYPATSLVTFQLTFAQSADGNRVTCFQVPASFSFTTGEFAGPFVVSTSPVDGATDVDRLAPIIVTFSSPMVTDSVAITCDSGGPFTVTWSDGDTVATLTHSTLFPPTATVTCQVLSGEDALGRTLQPGPVPNPWSFTTGLYARPHVTATSPVNGAIDVDRLAPVVVTFSDPMDEQTVAISCSSGAPFTVSWDGTSTIATFTHTALWAADTAVTCVVTGQREDGVTLQAGPVPNPWSFTTGQVARPYIVTTTPADGDANVPRTQPITIVFSDPINPSSLEFTCTSGGPFTAVWSDGNTVVTLTPSSNYAAGTAVTCQVLGAQDEQGRDVVTSAVPNPWTFSTQTGSVGSGTEFTITAFVGGSRSTNRPGGVGSIGGDDPVTPDQQDPVPPASCEFRDVPPSHWAAEYIREVCTRGIVHGHPDGTYRPQQTITRAEFLKMVLRLNNIGVDGPLSRQYPDVSINHSLYRYIQEGTRLGIVHGYDDGTFRPDQPVGRAEAVKILFNAAGVKVGADTRTSFEDVHASDWFAAFVAYAERLRIVDGDNNRFHPHNHLTRAEAAKLITKALQLRITRA